ncbi:MAG: NUDIX hydrolase [Pseudomonadota bacterium]
MAYQSANTPAIDAHWAGACRAQPGLFDGVVHFVQRIDRQDHTLTATAIPARFATLHFWREQGFPAMGALHLFGFALLVARDGAVLMGQMSDKTANAGQVYCPGGVVDQGDVVDGQIDITGNVIRELAEETGLTPASASATVDPRFIVVETDTALAIGHRIDLPWPAVEARARVLASAQAHGDGEIDDILIFRTPADAAGHRVNAYALHLLDWLLPEEVP